DYTYEDLDKSIMKEIGIIVNCTPVGMYPEDEKFPDIPYNDLHHDHILFDLVYNPEKTLFLQLGEEKKCTVKNGWEMLSLQAEKSWEIWKNLENRFLKA
ncbi:MAG: shikimate dehydrogenase, partial [Saprospiraceae bacterium]|nr:shikimate dehydrogenase [Saprospiraceae bacterium]